jgi:hypothetical protein
LYELCTGKSFVEALDGLKSFDSLDQFSLPAGLSDELNILFKKYLHLMLDIRILKKLKRKNAKQILFVILFDF